MGDWFNIASMIVALALIAVGSALLRRGVIQRHIRDRRKR